MDDLIIRKAKLDDIKGIMNIHRNCDDPWHNKIECSAWIEKRLDRSFYIQVAEFKDKIIGHGEWIISEEPKQKILYLGMLQIDDDYQKMGCGRAMIYDGAKYARTYACSKILTIPESETNSVLFYEKCGFFQNRKIKSCIIQTKSNQDYFGQRIIADTVPFTVVKDLPFVFGLSQSASRHMWEVCNNKPLTDSERLTPVCLCDGSYIQLSYRKANDTALALCWTKSNSLSNLITYILSFGYEYDIKFINFIFSEEIESLFKGFEVTFRDIEIVKFI